MSIKTYLLIDNFFVESYEKFNNKLKQKNEDKLFLYLLLFRFDIYMIFICDTLFVRYKKSIIIILYKKNKKNYSLSESYRLIVLENTFVKIVEKMLATRLNNVTEQYFLFL